MWVFKKPLTYLGHGISEAGIETDDSKVKALWEWPTPKNSHIGETFSSLYKLITIDLSISMHKSANLCINWFWEEMNLKRTKLLCGTMNVRKSLGS